MKRALITGISGQDGSYLAELLLEKGYEVHGLVRRESFEDPVHRLQNLGPVLDSIQLHQGAVDSYASIFRILNRVKPDECYHLAAASFVSFDSDSAFIGLNTNINSTHYLLSAIQEADINCRFYHAGSSEMFGNAIESPQNETSVFNPRTAYGISKVAGYHLTKSYREQYGLFAATGILFNHESPRRGYQYVTRKIISHAVRIATGEINELRLGNLDAKRDWGHSKDYVRAMWLMLQAKKAEDLVIATGELHTVRDLLEIVFSKLNLNYAKYVTVDERFLRPLEKIQLCGDATKAKGHLNWKCEYTFEGMVDEMLKSECRRLEFSC
jgi:GDPmannose 4,6-dehydratase